MTTWQARMRVRPDGPRLVLGSDVVTGEALVDGAEAWAQSFRSAGLRPGDRLVTALPTGAGLAQVVLAGLWEGLTLVPLAPETDPVVAAAEADPVAAVIAAGGFGGRDVPWAWRTDQQGRPASPVHELRLAGPRTPEARLLCPASGGGPWAALLDDNLDHAVDAVLGALQPERARWLSVVPWHSAAGLLLDLLPALLQAQDLVRTGEGDAVDVAHVAQVVQRWQPTHAILPLHLVGDLRALWGDLRPLSDLLGGLASGPGLDSDLARDLARTRLRSHRGAPELSCMVTLGEPGMWRPGALGRPVGCTISDGPGGGLLVRGRPIAGGRWLDGALHLVDRLAPVEVALT